MGWTVLFLPALYPSSHIGHFLAPFVWSSPIRPKWVQTPSGDSPLKERVGWGLQMPRLSVRTFLDACHWYVVLLRASCCEYGIYWTEPLASDRDRRLGNRWGDRPGDGLGNGCRGGFRYGPWEGSAGRGLSRGRGRPGGGWRDNQPNRGRRGLTDGSGRGQGVDSRGRGCDGLRVGGRGDVGNNVRGHGGNGHRDGQRDEDPGAGVNAWQRAGCRSGRCWHLYYVNRGVT